MVLMLLMPSGTLMLLQLLPLLQLFLSRMGTDPTAETTDVQTQTNLIGQLDIGTLSSGYNSINIFVLNEIFYHI